MSETPLQSLVNGLRAATEAISSVKIPGATPRAEQAGIVAIWPRGGKLAFGFSMAWEVTCQNGDLYWMIWGNGRTRESAEASVRREMPLCTVKHYDADPNPPCLCSCVREDHEMGLGHCYTKAHGCAEYRPAAPSVSL